MSDSLKRAIILTIAYSDQFSFPLKLEEIFQRLLFVKTTKPLLVRTIIALIQERKIELMGEYYFLPGREKLIFQREKRLQLSIEKRQEIDQFLGLVKNVFFIEAIFLTGSVTQNNAKANDDLDFLIVVKKNRLWLTRIIVMLLVNMVGKRRSWHSEEENSWCLNLWLETDQLQMSSKRHNIYTAYEVVQAENLFERNDVGKNFFKQNLWVKKFLPNYQSSNSALKLSAWRVKFENAINALLFPFFLSLNLLSFIFQKIYMLPHQTREEVSYQKAFFHPRDTKSLVFSNLKKSLIILKS